MAYIAPILNIAVWPVLDIWRAGKFLRFKRSEAVLTVWTTGFPCGYRAGQSNCRSAGSVLYDGFAGIDFQESPRFGGGNFSRADSKNPPHSGGLRFARALKSALGARKKRAPCSSVFAELRGERVFLIFAGSCGKQSPCGLFRYFDIGLKRLDFYFHAVCHVGGGGFVEALVQQFRIEEVFEEVFYVGVVGELAEDFRD